MEPKVTMTVLEVSKKLQISRALAYQLCRENRLPVIRLGAKRLIIPSRLFEEFLAGRWTPPGANGTGNQ